ncbi:MAG: formyltransferase family protein [Candidatus Cloacimonadaceae bacterium]
MKIWIITMEDPVYTVDFIKTIISECKYDVLGLTITRGNRFKIGKGKSKVLYALSLFIIMGIPFSAKLLLKKIRYSFTKNFFPSSPLTLSGFAKKNGLIVNYVANPNSKSFLEKLNDYDIDVIISQSQHILKRRLLSIPSIGVLNRHNALLPKNRGRLTPFWVLYKKEKETGVSIHFVDEKIDSGSIVRQVKYDVPPNATFGKIVNENYQRAAHAMLDALDIIKQGEIKLIRNDDEHSTYNSIPTFRQALVFRLRDPIGIFRM